MDVVADGGRGGFPTFNQAAMPQGVQSEIKNGKGTEEQHGGLQHRGVHDDPHAAADGVQAGGEGQSQGDDPEHINLSAEN